MQFSLLSSLACGVAALMLMSVPSFSQEKTSDAPIRVACLGASITVGVGTGVWNLESFPAQLQRMLGTKYEIRNFGVSGTTLLSQGDKPYIKEGAFQDSLNYKADIVLIDLGGNDSKPENWKFKDQFVGDYISLIDKIKEQGNAPRIYICSPTLVAGEGNFGINEPAVLQTIPMMQSVAKTTGAKMIDMHTPMLGKENLIPDRVHPNTQGANIMSRAAYRALAGKEFTGELSPTIQSDWFGYKKFDFIVDGRAALVVVPKTPAKGSPWIWRTEFFGHEPQGDIALLGKGFHVAYIDVQNMYGGPIALDYMDKLYAVLRRDYGISSKAVLEGFSRGGLFAFNWAARNPSQVASIYVDAPALDIKSWPGCFGKSEAKSPDDWERCKQIYGFKSDDEAKAYKLNPVDNLKPLGDAHIPILSVCGGADTAAIFEENTGLVQERYPKMGGEIEVIIKPGIGHHPHSLADPTPIVDFVLKHTAS